MTAAFEPAVPLLPILTRRAGWEEVDAALSRALGRPALGVPSVRVGMLWLLEDLGLSRHKDEVLVPAFLGRCVLDALARAAMPTQEPGPRVKAAIIVHFFGRRSPAPSGGLPFVEDASDALGIAETPLPGSLGKFIALSKLLPAAKGGCFIAGAERASDVIRRRRAQSGAACASLFTLGTLALHRRGSKADGSAWVEAAYALYPSLAGDGAALRGGLLHALDSLEEISALENRRLEALRGPHLIPPDDHRLLRAALLAPEKAEAVRRAGFDASLYHYDGKNLACAVPLHPGVPEDSFQELLRAL